MAYQKAYNRSIDAPTVVEPSSADAITAIAQINVMLVCIQFTKLHGMFKGTDDNFSIKKFVSKFKELVETAFNNVPGINAINIIQEYDADTNVPAFSKEANEAIFRLLSNVTSGAAFDLIDPYERADSTDSNVKVGRRAFLAILREHCPITASCCKSAEANLRNFKFTTNKDTNSEERTKFRNCLHALGEARGTPLTKLEKWNALTDSISNEAFTQLRVILTFQPEAKSHNIDWLLNVITEFVSEHHTTEKPTDKGVAFGASATSIENTLNSINATLAAITTGAMTAPRGPHKAKKNDKDKASGERRQRDRPDYARPPMTACRFCPDQLLWGRDIPKLAELEKSEKEKNDKPKLGAISSNMTAGKGFALGVHAAPKKTGGLFRRVWTATMSNPMLWMLSVLTGRAWLNIIVTVSMIVTFATYSVSSAGSMLAAITLTSPPITIANNTIFKVDSGASDHICSLRELFRDFDKTTAKVFEVVHGDPVRSLGTGTIDLVAKDSNGEWHNLTLGDVHYIPNQAMNLISVSKAISKPGVSNPDFVNRAWRINDKMFKLIDTHGTFSLDAHPAPANM